MGKIGPKIINTEEVAKDTQYEPPLIIAWGVDESTTGTKTITMGRTIIPPGGRNQRHYHANSDAAFFVRKGSIKVFIGEEKKEYIVPENHFVFTPAGGIHGLGRKRGERLHEGDGKRFHGVTERFPGG